MKVAFTIATANYLAQAKTVGDSFLRFNPEYKFFIALLDKVTPDINALTFESLTLVEIESMQIPFFDEMVERYSIFELSNALKPYCAEFFLSHHENVETLIYLDSDIFVYNNFDETALDLKTHNIVLTAHLLSPPPLDGMKQSEISFLRTGIYNGGFFAIKKNKESLKFLKWWQERMRNLCFMDLNSGLFVDQNWLNFVPVYFEKVKVVNNMGYNVAYWNLHEREINKITDVGFIVNNKQPLVFFHFSGFNIMNSNVISKFQNRFTFESRPDILPIFDNYKSQLIKNNFSNFSQMVCYYNKLGIAKSISGSNDRPLSSKFSRFVKNKLFR